MELPDDGLPWLYATARNVVGTRYRSDTRWALLADRLTAVPSEPTPDAVQITERDALVTALATLSDEDRELVLLVIWEGLEVREAAASLGISAGAAATRLHRARARLRAALTDDNAHPNPTDARRTSSTIAAASAAARPNPAPASAAARPNPADEEPSSLDAELEADR